MNDSMQATQPEQPVAKPKRQLTDAQRAALQKGRERLAAKRRAEQEVEKNELVNLESTETNEELVPETYKSICANTAIVLLSYFIMFIVSQHV